MASSGWYNDESDPALARWHDGVAWTDHVTEKAEWERIGVEPPPPEPLVEGSYVDDRLDRRRATVAALVAVAVLAVGGVALARDGGGGSDRPSTDEQPAPSERLGDATAESGDAPALDAGTLGTEPGTTPAAVGGSSGTGSGTSRSRTASTTSGGVKRSETATNTHTNTGPVTSIGDIKTGDKTSVGNTNDTTITTHYVPPPPTTTTAPPETTTTTTPTSTSVDPSSTSVP